jgi:RimK family alpha-L-glutamate ligase
MSSAALIRQSRSVIVALVGNPTRTNVQLAYAWRRLSVDARILWPGEAGRVLGPDDVAITRLDVVPTLDGIEPGLELVDELERRGVRVLNRPDALRAAHDKLLTAARLEDAGIPHPRTRHVEPGRPIPDVPFPCVLKPRFGSWGQDVFLCHTEEELARMLEVAARRPWWARQGAVLQELVGASPHRDLRVVLAGGRVAAAAQRIAAEHEWRTNVTLGGRVVKAELPEGAEDVALRAVRAIGIDFAGVDLIPVDEGWVVLELNGAVDFDRHYALPGVDPYAVILEGLDLLPVEMQAAARSGRLPSTETEVTMTKTVKGKPARAGDEIVITGHSVGNSARTALILEVLGETGHERFRVRWEDGHESIFFPGEDAVVKRPTRRRTKSPTA